MPPFFAATAASTAATTPFESGLTAAMSLAGTASDPSSLFARQAMASGGGLLQACPPPPANLSSPEQA